MQPSSQPILHLEAIRKAFGKVVALDGIDLSVWTGEFITLLGPSGCGKTTTLRIISGLEQPDRGRVLLNGIDVTELEPNRRDVNTVFQNYALFPHMTVAANVGYSLKLRKVLKADIERRVAETLELVQLAGYGDRMPNELSGGQRQRVAIARSVVGQPSILLLDEPLGALDLQLRRQMQIELKRLQKQLGITFVYITHDQEEALNMSDRIAVMRDGHIEQLGAPGDIYDRPKTSFVASFVGSANVLSGRVESLQDDLVLLRHPCGLMQVSLRGAALRQGQIATLAIRSEQVDISSQQQGINLSEGPGLFGTIKEKSFNGGMLRIAVEVGEIELIVSRYGLNSALSEGESVRLNWQPDQAILLDLEVADEA